MYFFGACDPSYAWPLVRDHHYSGRMPSNIQQVYCVRGAGGLFGDSGEVVGACIFSIPPTRWSEDVIELSRLVRAPNAAFSLSWLVSSASAWISKHDWNLAVSFADWTQRHHGGIYQAASWKYAGKRDNAIDGVIIDGKFVPGRSSNSRWGTRSPAKLTDILGREVQAHRDEGKHLYWKALHRSGTGKASRLGLQSLSYPKPAGSRMDAPSSKGCESGATPDARSNYAECDDQMRANDEWAA